MIFIFFPSPPKKTTPTHPIMPSMATCHRIPPSSSRPVETIAYLESWPWATSLRLGTQQNCHQNPQKPSISTWQKWHAERLFQHRCFNQCWDGCERRWGTCLEVTVTFFFERVQGFEISFAKSFFFHVGVFPMFGCIYFFFGGGLRVAFFVPGLVFLLILQWSLQNFTVRKWKTFTSCWKLVPNRQREDWPQGIPTDWQRVQPWSLGGHKISEGFYLFPIRSSFFLKETKIIRWASTSYKWNYNPYRCPGGFMNTQVKQLYTSRGGGLVLAQPKLLCRLEGTLPEEWFNLYIS